MAIAPPVSPAAAKPLQSETCVKLADEHAKLRKGGMEAAMDQQDPQKAREALNSDALAKIERYLFIEGQIRFRCPKIKLPGLEAKNKDKSNKGGNGAVKKKPAKKSQSSGTPSGQNTFLLPDDRG